MELSKSGRVLRRLVKMMLYSQLSFMDGILVLLRLTKSYVRFTVEADPPSIFYNFRVLPDKVKDLERHINLPDGFTMEKMRFLENDKESDYFVSLNVYRVSGITNALRAEWSVFVKNHAEDVDVVRYMVTEAQSSTLTMDPVNIFERARKVDQSMENNHFETVIESFDNATFSATFDIPDDGSIETAYSAREWLKSIDLIYWLNGIGDRTYYDGGMACAAIKVIPPKLVTIEDTTQWSEFIEPVPDSVLLFPDAISFVMSPWWNI